MNSEGATRPDRGWALGLGLLFLLTGLAAVAGSWGAYWLDAGILRDGRSAEGRVTGKDLAFDAGGDSDFIIEYVFSPLPGERLQASRGVGKDLWESLEEGDALLIYYSADDPARNFPQGGGVTLVAVTWFVSLLGLAFVLFGAMLVRGTCRGISAR